MVDPNAHTYLMLSCLWLGVLLMLIAVCIVYFWPKRFWKKAALSGAFALALTGSSLAVAYFGAITAP